jgi:exodeoxyribonuclease-3
VSGSIGRRILAINLRSGGNATTIPAIVRRAQQLDAGTIVSSEYRNTASGQLLRDLANACGFAHQAWTTAIRGNGVLVVSEKPFDATTNPFGLSDDEYPNAVLKAAFEDFDLFGVYLPGQDRKRPHLRYLISIAKRYVERNAPAICIGDFNSGRNDTDIEINVRSGKLLDEFSTSDLYRELETVWAEAWTHLHPGEFEFSWYPFRRDPDYVSNAGWRIDKAFVSPALLPHIDRAEYDHFFRLDRLTDHSGLLVEIEE